MGNYAGIDWAAEKHDVRVCDEAGEELLVSTFARNRASSAPSASTRSGIDARTSS